MRKPVLAGTLVAAFVTAGLGAQVPAPSCDRACLIGIVDAYLGALAAHDPARAPLARGVRFTENTGVLEAGEGLWVGASEAPATFKIYVPDPSTNQIGFFGVLKEFDRPVLLALRLRLQGSRITEAEHVVARSLTEAGLKNLTQPRAVFAADVPLALRVPRAEMVRIADSYYDSLSKGQSALTPYADDCVRHENGMQTSTNRTPPPLPPGAADQQSAFATLGRLGCAAQMDTKMFAYITSIDLRRVQIVDEQTGLVFGLTMFRHLGKLRTLPLAGVPGLTSMPMNFGPIDLQAAHIFKISGGRLHEIEAMGYTLPFKSNSGWER
jgi:hypothetical protein